jgi:aspartate carbamoyltransferase regulatory subunit
MNEQNSAGNTNQFTDEYSYGSSAHAKDECKDMKLGKIKDGTVLDHIPPRLCFKLVDLLNLEGHGNVVSTATNLPSHKLGRKGMIKISNKFLTEEEVNKIAVVAPNVTMCTINEFNVVKKVKLSLPLEILNIVKCNNPNCITNVENVNTHFVVLDRDKLKLKCTYCERSIDKEYIQLKD